MREKRTNYIEIWQRTFRLIRAAVPKLTAFWILLLFGQGLLPSFSVYFTKKTIDSFIFAHNQADSFVAFNETFYYLCWTGFCLILAEILQYAADWTKTAQAEYFSDYLKNLIHRQSAEVDLEFYESPEYHDLMEQARGEAQSKPLALLDSFGTSLQNLITLVSFAGLLLVYGWFIPALLLAGALPGLFISVKYDRIFHKWWKTTANDRRWLMYFDSMLSHSNAAAEMRLFDLSGKFRERYQNLRGKLRTEKLFHLRRQFAGKLLANVFAMIIAAGVIGWIALKVFYKTATLGDLAVFYQVFSRGQSIIRALFGGIGQTLNNTLYLESLFAFLDLPAKIASPEKSAELPEEIKFGIYFRNVTFRYPASEQNAVGNFELFIPAGKTIAIVGLNGAGKSTLIKLLSRFYDPQKGAIEIDGTDIRNVSLEKLRRKISVLFQFPMQFHETVADNIALGDTEKQAEQTRVKQAASLAGAHEFIAKLPENYQTLLGKWFVKGCELSGGEWQKIALARAYFRKSALIILDEPTSFMDSWAEADWFDRFRLVAHDKTSLIITHRFTIAMRADLIHVLDKGRLIESGTHAQLLEKDGFYAQSWKNQMQTAAAVSRKQKKSPLYSIVKNYNLTGKADNGGL